MTNQKQSLGRRIWNGITRFFFRYILVHMAYIAILAIIAAAIITVIEKDNPNAAPGDKPDFWDSLYCTTSAVTCTGYMTYDYPQLHHSSQIILLILTQLGGGVFLSLFPMIIRRAQIRRNLKGHHRMIWYDPNYPNSIDDRIFYNIEQMDPNGYPVPWTDPSGYVAKPKKKKYKKRHSGLSHTHSASHHKSLMEPLLHPHTESVESHTHTSPHSHTHHGGHAHVENALSPSSADVVSPSPSPSASESSSSSSSSSTETESTHRHRKRKKDKTRETEIEDSSSLDSSSESDEETAKQIVLTLNNSSSSSSSSSSTTPSLPSQFSSLSQNIPASAEPTEEEQRSYSGVGASAVDNRRTIFSPSSSSSSVIRSSSLVSASPPLHTHTSLPPRTHSSSSSSYSHSTSKLSYFPAFLLKRDGHNSPFASPSASVSFTTPASDRNHQKQEREKEKDANNDKENTSSVSAASQNAAPESSHNTNNTTQSYTMPQPDPNCMVSTKISPPPDVVSAIIELDGVRALLHSLSLARNRDEELSGLLSDILMQLSIPLCLFLFIIFLFLHLLMSVPFCIF